MYDLPGIHHPTFVVSLFVVLMLTVALTQVDVFGSFQADDFAGHNHTGTSGDAGNDPARIGGGNRNVDTGIYPSQFYRW